MQIEDPTEAPKIPQLAEDDEQINLHGIDDSRDTMVCMLRQAKHEVLFCSRLMDPPLLNNNETIEALRKIIVNHRNFHMRIIVYDPGLLARTSHRLLGFGRSKPSFFSFRKPAEQHAHFEQTLFLVDNIGLIYRPKSDHWRGVANFNDPSRVQHLKETFNTLWNYGEPDQELRQLRV